MAGKWDLSNWTEAGPGSQADHVTFLDTLGYKGPGTIQFPQAMTGAFGQAYAQAQKGRKSVSATVGGSQPGAGRGSAGSASGTGATNPAHAGATSSSANRALGQKMAARMGWTAQNGQWQALDYLWGTGESGWRNTARNSSTGAYGIAQALGHGPSNQYPGGKYMKANPAPFGTSDAGLQISWGLWYIKTVYGNPQNALRLWRSRSPHWY